MFTKIIRRGFIIGVVGGASMALFAMFAMWATGRGFFTVVNIFAHTFWNDAPLDGTFALGAFGLGTLIHLVMSTLVGTIIAFFVERGSLDAEVIIGLGLAIGFAVWVVQALAWSALDEAAHQQFTPWILAVAHVVFALGAATLLALLKSNDAQTAAIEKAAAVVNTQTFRAPRPTRDGFTRMGFQSSATDEDGLENFRV